MTEVPPPPRRPAAVTFSGCGAFYMDRTLSAVTYTTESRGVDLGTFGERVDLHARRIRQSHFTSRSAAVGDRGETVRLGLGGCCTP